MVVAATGFSKALSDPLQAIQDLYEKNGDRGGFPAAVGTHFQSLFRESEARAKITPLTPALLRQQPLPESGPSTQNPRLVRWRCMIQDTSLGSELMPSRYRASDGSWRNGLFGGASAGEEADGEPDIHPSQLSSLTTLYAVSLPGQSRWSQLADQRLDSSTSPLDAELLARMAGADLGEDHGAGGESSAASRGGLDAKLPTGAETGLLLKVYDEDVAESVRVAQVVDVIGILDQSALPSADWDEAAEGHPAGATLHPAIHVVCMQRADVELGDAHDGNEAEIRDALIGYLAQGLQGDRLAAEWLLLSLIARIHTRSSAHTLGALSLNISSYQPSTSMPLPAMLSDIMPYVVSQSLELTHLNDKATHFAPSSLADDMGLHAGRLQLVDGTLLLIDESTMQEGQLKEKGIDNIRALSNMLTTRKLTYTFPYSSLEMDTDVHCVVVSQGKSFLPVNVQVALRPEPGQALDERGQGSSSATSSRFSLDDYRHYLAAIQLRSSQAKQFSITAEMADKIQDDFVHSRSTQGRGGDVDGTDSGSKISTQEDLSRLIHVARLLSLSRGDRQLSWQDWKRAKTMDAERVRRTA